MSEIRSTIFIHAVNIHEGGGKVLLSALLSAIDKGSSYVLLADQRMPLPPVLDKNVKILRVKKSIISRLAIEFWLYRAAGKNDIVLCFGNLPPLFRLHALTNVFVHNRYLVENVKLNGFNLWARLRITLERCWLRLSMLHANRYFVQTPTMQRLINVMLKGSVPVMVIPFATLYSTTMGPQTTQQAGKDWKFIYVASGDAHKNHRCLIDAWCLLAADGFRPHLSLTVDKTAYRDLCTWIAEQSTKHNLRVQNIGSIDSSEIGHFYGEMDALIYPSLLESFGLPLIEAKAAGLRIVAAELDYVRDIISPDQTFDASSPTSIARAVKRLCGVSEPELKIQSPRDFLAHCTENSRGAPAS